MMRWLFAGFAIIALGAILILRIWNGPILGSAKLAAMKAEAQSLMQTHPPSVRDGWTEIPRSDWPPAIAGLHPERVHVARWGVTITTKSYFDGGWGYHIPNAGHDLPMPRECYSEPGDGVFWHGPC